MKQMNVIYLRCSSDLQSVEHQEKSCLDYARRNNIIISKVYKDEGISAYSKDYSYRDGFKEVLSLAHEGRISNLLIFEASRLSRGMMEYQILIQEFTNCNVKVHDISTNSIINQSELDTLMNAFKGWMNQNSSKQTSLRVKSAKKLLREQGKFQGGATPYGFVVIDGYEVPDEELRPVIESFFDDYIAYGRKYVSEKYGIKNRKTVVNRIRNEKYVKIVGSDKWQQANSVMTNRVCTKNKPTKALNRTEKLLEGLLFHEHCKGKLTLYRDRNNRGTTYRCLKCKGTTVSAKKSFSGETLTSNIEQEILTVLDNLNHDSLRAKYHSKCYQKQAIIELKIKELTNTHSTKLRALQLGKSRLQEGILSNAPNTTLDAISNMIASVTSELADLEEQLTSLRGELESIKKEDEHQEALIANVLQAKEIYKNADTTQKKAILNLLVRNIEVNDTDDFSIFLNI